MMDKELYEQYEQSPDFKRYVDRSAANYGLTVDEVFSQALTREVAKSYMDKKPGSASESAYMPMGECV